MSINNRFLPALGVLALALAVPGSAQAADFSIFGSYWNTDGFDEAVGAGVRVGFFEQVQLELGATYYDEFGNDFRIDLGDEIGFEDVTLDVETIPIDAGVRFNFGGSPLYLAGGGTYYLLSTDPGSVDDEYGWYARVGAQFSNFFVEGGYRSVEGTVEDPDDIDEIDFVDRIDIDLAGWLINAGWRF